MIVLELTDDRTMAIHAMPLRSTFYDLLPRGEDPMPEKPKTYRTKTGKVLTDADIEAMADEAERGYDVEQLKA